MNPLNTHTNANQPCNNVANVSSPFKSNKATATGYTVPDWLEQPQFVSDAEAHSPNLNARAALAKPQNTLTVGAQNRHVPFRAYNLDGPAAEAFKKAPKPKGKVEAERADSTGKSVQLLSFSHTVCNSVGHALYVHAMNGTSNHGIIDVDGTVHQLVDLKHKAFPAGRHNERVIGFTFQNPVDPRVKLPENDARPRWTGGMPRHDGDYTCWGVSDAQKRTAGEVLRWLSQQPDFDIDATVADPHLVPADEAAVDASFGSFKGAVGLYQLRPIHIAPGFDAMQGVANSLNDLRRVSGQLAETCQAADKDSSRLTTASSREA